MSEQDLRILIEAASEAVDVWFKKHGRLSPVWYAMDAEGNPLVVPSLSDDKNIAVALIRAMFELADIKCYVFIDEAWMLDRRLRPGGAAPNVEAEIAALNKHGLADHPERIEIVMFSAEHHQTGQLMAHRVIHRPPGKQPYLGPIEWPLMGERHLSAEGRMVGLLPHKGSRQ